MSKLIGNARPEPESLQQMRERGGRWAAYQNHDMGSAELGHLRFVKVGPGCTLATPPERHPDTPSVIGWRYLYVGMVNTETGDIDE